MRSSLILLIIIAAIALLRFVIPPVKPDPELIVLQQNLESQDSLKTVVTGSVTSNPVPRPRTRKNNIIIELNTCDSAALESLPGVGPVLSSRIIKYRNLLGGYASVEQLREVYGLKPATFDLISGRLKADATLIRKININTADFRKLIRLPYFEKAEVTSILNYRKEKGKIASLEELVDKQLITKEKIEKIRWYIEF